MAQRRRHPVGGEIAFWQRKAGRRRGGPRERAPDARGRPRGDEQPSTGSSEPHRGELHAHCYRMLGSAADAEDALQEALLRAWRGLASFEGRSSLRSWLYAIATNACLRAIERRPKRVLPIDYAPAADPHDGPGEPLVESVWVEPYPDERLGLEDGLAGPTRATSSARASSSRSSPRSSSCRRASAPCSSSASARLLGARGGRGARDDAGRGRQRAAARPQGGGRAASRAQPAGDAALARRRGLREIVDRTATPANAPTSTRSWRCSPRTGRSRCRRCPLVPRPRGGERLPDSHVLTSDKRWRIVPTRANGQLAFGNYRGMKSGEFGARSISVLTLDPEGIAEITTFLGPELLARFGLPDEL